MFFIHLIIVFNYIYEKKIYNFNNNNNNNSNKEYDWFKFIIRRREINLFKIPINLSKN